MARLAGVATVRTANYLGCPRCNDSAARDVDFQAILCAGTNMTLRPVVTDVPIARTAMVLFFIGANENSVLLTKFTACLVCGPGDHDVSADG